MSTAILIIYLVLVFISICLAIITLFVRNLFAFSFNKVGISLSSESLDKMVLKQTGPTSIGLCLYIAYISIFPNIVSLPKIVYTIIGIVELAIAGLIALKLLILFNSTDNNIINTKKWSILVIVTGLFSGYVFINQLATLINFIRMGYSTVGYSAVYYINTGLAAVFVLSCAGTFLLTFNNSELNLISGVLAVAMIGMCAFFVFSNIYNLVQYIIAYGISFIEIITRYILSIVNIIFGIVLINMLSIEFIKDIVNS